MLILDNGARFTILNTELKLSPNGEQAITSLTRSERRTRAILNTE